MFTLNSSVAAVPSPGEHDLVRELSPGGLSASYDPAASPGITMQCNIHVNMGQFGQFGLNGFKPGQTHFSQLHIYLDPDKLKSGSLITTIRGFAKVTYMGCDR